MTTPREPVVDDEMFWALETMDKLMICGCGRPDTAYELVRDLLRLMPLYEEGRREKAEELCGSTGAFYWLLGVLTDAADLIEHGGGIGGSWMLPDGERFLAALERVEDWDEFDYEHIQPAREVG